MLEGCWQDQHVARASTCQTTPRSSQRSALRLCAYPHTSSCNGYVTSTNKKLSNANVWQIPGHHFPPIVITATLVYLTTVFRNTHAFGPNRPTLREAFPNVFRRLQKKERVEIAEETDDDHHEPVLYEDEKHVVKTLLFGVPDWREAEYSYMSIGINILLALFTLDMVFRGPLFHLETDLRFSRVGYVDSISAKVLFREPDPTHQLPLYAYYKPVQKTKWITAEKVYHVGPDTDYTHVITFSDLQSATTYDYSLSNKLNGTFTTTPSPASRAGHSLTFLTSSCIKANFPYNPLSHSLSIHGFDYLSKVIQSLPSPASFMLFLGDFIYVDVPLRLSSSLSHYRAEYRRVYASPSWSLPGISSVPWIHTLDDHEIANDWCSGNCTDPFPAASDPFINYHVSTNPPLPPDADPESNVTYFQFTSGPASFFMLDTRRYRTNPEPQSGSAIVPSKPLYGSSAQPGNPPSHDHPHTMLGHTQLSSLLTYLSSPEPAHIHWKFIASSVPFTKNWRFGTPDTWGGFTTERSLILSAMHAAESQLGVRVIVLSGDRHEFAAIRYPPPQHTSIHSFTSSGEPEDTQTQYDATPHAGPHEFSVGPLSMFYLPLRTFKQVDGQDVAIKYLPDGNSKVGVVRVENLQGGSGSVLRYTLWIDGAVAWEYVLTSPGSGFVGRK